MAIGEAGQSCVYYRRASGNCWLQEISIIVQDYCSILELIGIHSSFTYTIHYTRYSAQLTQKCSLYSTLLMVLCTQHNSRYNGEHTTQGLCTVHYYSYPVQYTISCTQYSTLLKVLCTIYYSRYSEQLKTPVTKYSTLLQMHHKVHYSSTFQGQFDRSCLNQLEQV